MKCMLIIIQQGGIAPGGNNFDCKLRRESSDVEDLFIAHAGGMDCLARGLRAAGKLVESGLLQKTVEKRYASWNAPLGAKIERGEGNLVELEAHAKQLGETTMQSGKQEFLEQNVTRFIQ